LMGLVLSVLTVLFTLGKILLNLGWLSILMTAVALWYGYCAICRTSSRSSVDELFLNLGVRWGVAIGCLFAIAVLAGLTIGGDYALLVVVFALLLPFLAGALSAISSGKVRRGTSVGHWSGMIGGLIGFFVFAGLAYLRPLLLGVPVFPALERSEYYPFL